MYDAEGNGGIAKDGAEETLCAMAGRQLVQEGR